MAKRIRMQFKNLGGWQIFLRVLESWALIALGVLISAHVVPGIDYSEQIGTLLAVVLLLSIFNMVLKPILLFLTLPFILITFGFGIVLINALLFMLVGEIVPGFVVTSFWAALLGSLIVSATSFLVNGLLLSSKTQSGGRPPPRGGSGGISGSAGPGPKKSLPRRPQSGPGEGGDVIDV